MVPLKHQRTVLLKRQRTVLRSLLCSELVLPEQELPEQEPPAAKRSEQERRPAKHSGLEPETPDSEMPERWMAACLKPGPES